MKHISKSLVQYVPAKEKVNPSQAAKHVSGAKILTSSECVAIFEEREKNKKTIEQEKDERKAKREERRNEKQEIARKKAEQKQTKQKAIQNNWKGTSSSKVDLALKNHKPGQTDAPIRILAL